MEPSDLWPALLWVREREKTLAIVLCFIMIHVSGNQYNVIKSEEISFNNFPMSVRGCGRQMSCFRSCSSSPTCDPENTDTYVVTFLSRDEKYVIASLGGVVNNDQVSREI